MPSSRPDLSVEDPSSALLNRRVGTATAIAASAGAGLLAAVFAVPGAFALWIGISVAMGRGDPTWNDGEEVWATALGLLLTGLVSLAIYLGVRASNVRVGTGVRKVVVCLWIVPAVGIHVLFSANALS